MKPEIRLYFDFEFTSLSPDAMPISLGIVSEDWNGGAYQAIKELPIKVESKSFYAEFSDFDLNRCDEWVKENVVSKLKYYGTSQQDKMFLDSSVDEGSYWGSQNTAEIKEALHRWLKQFSELNIQFVCDCGTFDWYWMLQLLAEWEDSSANRKEYYDIGKTKDCVRYIPYKSGLPKLPSNISPVPEDLNDLIANKKGISVREAFDLGWELEAIEFVCASDLIESSFHFSEESRAKALNENSKHNALWDAKVIKAIYEKLK